MTSLALCKAEFICYKTADQYIARIRGEWSTYIGQIIGRLEVTLARCAVVMRRRLAIVFLKAIIVLEHAVAGRAKGVVVFIVVFELVGVVEVKIAILAIIVVRTLHEMLLESNATVEVNATLLAFIVSRGVVDVLEVCVVRPEFAVTAIAVHRGRL